MDDIKISLFSYSQIKSLQMLYKALKTPAVMDFKSISLKS